MEKMQTDPAKGVKRVKEKMFHWLHLIPLLCIYDTQMKDENCPDSRGKQNIFPLRIIALQWSRIVSLLMVEEKCMS